MYRNPEIEEFFKKDSKKITALLKQFRQDKTTPLILPLYKFVEFAESLKQARTTISRSSNPRIIILETWLILDYCIRELLLAGLQLGRFRTSKFDILPQSFRSCLQLLQDFIQDQSKLPLNPFVDAIQLPGKFILFCIDEDEIFMDKLIELENKYYLKYHPTLLGEALLDTANPKYRNVDATWYSVAKNLDSNWFNKAEKLNKLRNLAAHDFSSESIYNELGIKGLNKLKLLRKYCNDMLKLLIGIK